jgi:hypothetical protein
VVRTVWNWVRLIGCSYFGNGREAQLEKKKAIAAPKNPTPRERMRGP